MGAALGLSMVITFKFSEFEKQTLCNEFVCNHLAKHWQGYKEIVSICNKLKNVDDMREDELWRFVEGRVRDAVNHVGLDDVTSAVGVDANEEGLIKVFIKLFILLDDHEQPPSRVSGGTKGC